jgi:hypothetical protein
MLRPMNLQSVLDLPANAPNRLCRFEPFGEAHREQMVREVLGLANADTQEPRSIVFGAHHDGTAINIVGLTDGDIACLEDDFGAVESLVEPNLKFEMSQETIDGKSIAVMTMDDCGDPPYVVKITVSDRLQRGECWVRADGKTGLASRNDLDRMYGRIQPVESPSVLVGFNGDADQQVLQVDIPDRSQPPSKRASEESAAEKIELHAETNTSSSETSIARARVVNARLPVAETALTEADNTIKFNAAAEEVLRKQADIYYFFEEQAIKINFSILNRTRLTFEDAIFELTFPRTPDLDISDRLHTPPTQKLSLIETGLMGYPEVEKTSNSIRVFASLGAVQPERQIDVFESAVRLAVGPRWRGKKIGIRYSLTAQNLKKPFTGHLKIRFTQ